MDKWKAVKLNCQAMKRDQWLNEEQRYFIN